MEPDQDLGMGALGLLGLSEAGYIVEIRQQSSRSETYAFVKKRRLTQVRGQLMTSPCFPPHWAWAWAGRGYGLCNCILGDIGAVGVGVDDGW